MAPPLTLISFDLCPYVQRAAIVLAEKGVPFERVNIDLCDKPAWFLAISPLGRVPVLRVGEEVLFESAVIAEYLDETTEPRLHPADPLRRARHRAWIEFASSMLDDTWVIETSKDEAAFYARVKTLRTKFERLEALPHLGPLLDGDRFHLADAAFAPVFRYFDTFDRMVPLGVLDGMPKVAAWRAALAERPSVRGAVVPDYAERLHAFVMAQGGVMAQRARRG
ncbi:glutathione S-transferase family protein [Falsiroseomonas sp. HW251]|uniref:glutathione S-transferase family protein n=1 Tax=Falsiroseomonas sp. HW251 TaxID=3390998 RepID=UPI003D318B76